VILVGSTAVQTGPDSDAPGTAEAFQYTAVGTGAVAKLAVYVDAGSAAGSVVVGLYADTGANHPAALLTQGTITNPANGSWNVAVVPPASVTAGTRYWIALLGPANTGPVGFRDRATGGGGTETSAAANLTTLPDTWSTGAVYANSPASAYAAP
jgi:hypothetical protein